MDTVPPIQPPFIGNIPPVHLPNLESSSSLTAQAKATYQRLIPTLASLEQRKRFLVKLQGILDLEFPDKRIKAHLFGCEYSILLSMLLIDVFLGQKIHREWAWDNVFGRGRLLSHGMAGPRANVPRRKRNASRSNSHSCREI
jgi:hypothetical protein